MNKKTNKSGFTLIELLVVTTIIIILSAIGLVSFANAGRSARDSKRAADMETVRQALVLYRSEVGTYPNVYSYTDMINELVDAGYLSLPAPEDPKSADGHVYSYFAVDYGSRFCLCAKVENSSNGNYDDNGCGESEGGMPDIPDQKGMAKPEDETVVLGVSDDTQQLAALPTTNPGPSTGTGPSPTPSSAPSPPAENEYYCVGSP